MAIKFNWKDLLLPLEQAGNVALLLSGLGAPFEPLAVALENAVNPLLLSAGSGNSVTQETIVVYGTLVGILTALKQNTKLPADVLTKVQEYLDASNAGLTAYIAAGNGFDPSLYTPVEPIA